MTSGHAPRDAAADLLYPFLAPAQSSSEEELLADLRRSSVVKFAEVDALRREIVDRDAQRIAHCAQDMAKRFSAGARLFAFGNGGSSTDAQSLVAAFTHPGGDLPRLAATALTNDAAVLTALANDVSFGVVFARQITAFARPGDIAVGLSTSGGSANVLAAFHEARRIGLLTVGLAGYDGGRMAESAAIDYLFVVPSESVHRIQEAQTTIYHLLWQLTVDDVAAAVR